MSAAFLSSASSTIRRAMSSGGRSAAGRAVAAAAAAPAASRFGRPSGRGGGGRDVGRRASRRWARVGHGRWILLGFGVTIQPIGRDEPPRRPAGRGRRAVRRRRRGGGSSDAETSTCGPSMTTIRSRAAGKRRVDPGGVRRRDGRPAARRRSRARSSSRSGSCQLGSPANDSADRITVMSGSRPAARSAAASAATVSTVYDGPARSSSIRLASSRGSPAIPASTIARRTPAGLIGRPQLVRRHGGRDDEDPLEPELVARGPGEGEVADVERIERAAEDPDRARPDRARCGPAVTGPPRAAPPTRARSRRSGRGRRRDAPARRSSSSIPSRARSRWKRSADSSTSKFVWAAIRSIRLPRTRNTPSSTRSTLKPSPIASIRWTTTPAGSGGASSSSALGQQLGDPRAERVEPRSRRPPRSRRRPRPSARRAVRNAGQASTAAGRSSLLNATRIGFSRSAGSWAAQLVADDVVVPVRIAAGAVDDVDEDPRPLDVAQERVAEARRRSTRPRSARARRRSSGGARRPPGRPDRRGP